MMERAALHAASFEYSALTARTVPLALERRQRHIPPWKRVDEILTSYVDGSLLQEVTKYFDRIACFHMSGLLVQPHLVAGQDGFRIASSQHHEGVFRQWGNRIFSRFGSIDQTICSFPARFDISLAR